VDTQTRGGFIVHVLTSLRRAPRLVVLLAVAVIAGAGAVAYAGGNGPGTTGYTPNKADQITNIDVLRQQIKNYFGTPTAKTGVTEDETTYAAPDSSYAGEAESVAAAGARWLSAQAHKPSVGTKAIVLDVDDTTLSTWNYELYSNWDYNFGTNSTFVTDELFPAVPGMVDMVNHAAAEGYAVFFITGRGTAQHDATLGNLTDSDAIGLDAGYVDPTSIGGGDGLFTKPSVGSYPTYLDKPEFCAAAIAADASCATVPYKSGTRAYIESMGYDIVASFGDQYSDLLGGYADRTFKMPNPNYYLP